MKYVKVKEKDFYKAYQTINNAYNMIYLIHNYCCGDDTLCTETAFHILPALNCAKKN